MKKIGWAVLALCATGFAQENLATWTKYKNITVNTKASGANVANVVTKFPVLVRLDSVNAPDVFAGAAAGGADIRFAKPDGTQRPYEIEQWDATAKKAAIWVLADTVKGNDSSVALRLYWGKSTAAAASNSSAVFDTANGFVGVWHLGNAAAANPRASAVTGAPPAIVRNAPVGYQPATGVIGLADSLIGGTGVSDGSGSPGNETGTKPYLDMGRTGYTGYSDFTQGVSYSVWINPNAALNSFERFLQLTVDTAQAVENASTTRLVFLRHTNNTGSLAMRTNGITTGNSATFSAPAGTWRQVAFNKQSGTDSLKIFVDGVRYYAYAPSADVPVALRNYFWIGRSFDPSNAYLNAKVDEPVLSKVSRSPDWMKLSFETQKPTAAALALGATQTQTPPSVALSKLSYVDTLKAADTLSFLTTVAVSRSLTISGGPVDSIKVIGTALPAGLTINKTSGLLSGTPTAATAAANYTVRAWGHASAADSISRTVRITVAASATALSKFAYVDTLKAADTLSYRVNTVVSRAAILSGGTPDSIKVIGTALPAGLTVNKTSGLLSGTPTTATAAADYTVRAWGHASAGDSLTRTVRITITAIPTLSYTKDSVVYKKDSLATANNATTNLTSAAFTVSPALPAGLALNATTGAITGTATALSAIAGYTVKAVSGTDTATKILYLSVVNGTVGIAGANGAMALGFNAKQGANGMFFSLQGMNAGDKAVLNLVDMAGHAVYSATFGSGSVLNWNGNTTTGQTASAGIYVARVTVTSAQGKLRQVLENRVPFVK